MKHINILVAISSCMEDQAKRDTIRECWLRHIPKDVECLFFTGSGKISEEETNDTVILDVPDGKRKSAARLIPMLRYALEHYDFDWIFHCDDGMYLDLSRMVNLTNDKYDLIGDVFLEERKSPDSSAGYLISRSMVEKITSSATSLEGENGDLALARLIHELGVRETTTDLLSVSDVRYPMPDNHIVSARCCDRDIMKAIYTFNYEKEDALYEAQHDNWKDDLLFYTNGVFRRTSTSCFGWWHLLSDGRLLLKWRKYASVVLLDKEGIYHSEHLLLKRVNDPPSLSIASINNNKDCLPLANPVVALNWGLYKKDLNNGFYNHIELLRSEIKKLNKLPNHVRILEWGSGMSTIILCDELKKDSYILSLEHEDGYRIDIPESEKDRLKQVFQTTQQPFGASQAYTTYPIYEALQSKKPFDLILIDGRNRADCLSIAAMLLAPDGVVILDDAERKNYQSAFSLYREVEFIRNKSNSKKVALFRKPVCTLARITALKKMRLGSPPDSCLLSEVGHVETAEENLIANSELPHDIDITKNAWVMTTPGNVGNERLQYFLDQFIKAEKPCPRSYTCFNSNELFPLFKLTIGVPLYKKSIFWLMLARYGIISMARSLELPYIVTYEDDVILGDDYFNNAREFISALEYNRIHYDSLRLGWIDQPRIFKHFPPPLTIPTKDNNKTVSYYNLGDISLHLPGNFINIIMSSAYDRILESFYDPESIFSLDLSRRQVCAPGGTDNWLANPVNGITLCPVKSLAGHRGTTSL